MFTGLIRALGIVAASAPQGGGRAFSVDVSGLEARPKSGASIAVSGVCLTVTRTEGAVATFDAVAETIDRTTLGALRVGATVNLEPSLRVGDPLDGHIVLGHVDAVSTVREIRTLPESWVFIFSLPELLRPLVAEKGSIAVDGVSLTVTAAGRDSFAVSVIPETYNRTTLGRAAVGARVNLEADVFARYAARRADAERGLTEDFLRAHGFA